FTFNPTCKAFTTVSAWDASDWIVDGDETYENTKRVAFLEFAGLPGLTRQPLELALFLRQERDLIERKDLERRGWRIRHSRKLAETHFDAKQITAKILSHALNAADWARAGFKSPRQPSRTPNPASPLPRTPDGL